MKEPKLYKRALTWSLSAVAIVYMTVAVTVYVLCGSHVSSPALGSAGPRFKIICYGIALIGLCVTACLMLHVYDPHISSLPRSKLTSSPPVRRKAPLPTRYCHDNRIPQGCQLARLYNSDRAQRLKSTNPSTKAPRPHHLVQLLLVRDHTRIHHRQRRPQLPGPGGTDRRLSGHLHLLPPDGLPVVPRQLAIDSTKQDVLVQSVLACVPTRARVVSCRCVHLGCVQ